MERILYDLGIALLVEIGIGIIVFFFRAIVNKVSLIHAEFNLNGRWENYHVNHGKEDIIEIYKIKQIKREIKVKIKQYKKKSAKNYHGNGVVSGASVMMYYIGADQAGTISLVMTNDEYGNSLLNGEYLEGTDLTSSESDHKPNKLVLRKLSVKGIEYFAKKIALAFIKNKEKKYNNVQNWFKIQTKPVEQSCAQTNETQNKPVK